MDDSVKNVGPDAEAAVAVILFVSEDPQILLLRRAQNPADPWSGHWALPGGRKEKDDGDLLATCIREAKEECGCVLSERSLLQTLPMAEAGGRKYLMRVQPFVFSVLEKPALELDEEEIAGFHWLSHSVWRDKSNHVQRVLSPYFENKEFPCLPLDEAIPLWGFTYELIKKVWKSD